MSGKKYFVLMENGEDTSQVFVKMATVAKSRKSYLQHMQNELLCNPSPYKSR